MKSFIDIEKFLSDLEEMPPNCFVAMLDIMGFKNIVEHESPSRVAKLFKMIHNRIQERGVSNDINISHFSDTILIVTKDDTAESFESIVYAVASFENLMIANGYAVNGCISYGGVTVEANNSFGEPISNAHLEQENLFFYGITLDENAVNKYYELCRESDLFSNGYGDLATQDMMVYLRVPTKKNGWVYKYMINWMDVFSLENAEKKDLLTYDDQISIIKKNVENLYIKYVENDINDGSRANMYILNTELVLREWYDYIGKVSNGNGWGKPLFDKFLINVID